MKIIICKYCKQEKTKYNREGDLFCNQLCYMEWKRQNPNKKAYKNKILINGYYYIYMPAHPNAIQGKRYVAEHRLVGESKLGRYLKENEIVHHINGIKTDNHKDNIIVMLKNQHDSDNAINKRRSKNGKFAKDFEI